MASLSVHSFGLGIQDTLSMSSPTYGGNSTNSEPAQLPKLSIPQLGDLASCPLLAKRD